jgi:hypothetical protein
LFSFRDDWTSEGLRQSSNQTISCFGTKNTIQDHASDHILRAVVEEVVCSPGETRDDGLGGIDASLVLVFAEVA